MRGLTQIATVAVLLTGSINSAFSQDDRAVLHGKELAEINCARCHSLNAAGDSPHPDAPPFRTLSERFPVDTIDEALLAGIRPAHEDMPKFEITPLQAHDIAAFIATLQVDLRGRRIVEANCAQCHAIDREDESLHADAPPFRSLSARYPIETLEEALAEGIVTGHPDMPEFIAEPDQIDAIITYLNAIQD